MTDTKFCVKCKTEKDRSEFSRNQRAKDGLFSYCKECARKHASDWYSSNTEKYNESARARWAKNPMKKKASNKTWRDKNQGTLSIGKMLWAVLHPRSRKESVSKYKKLHKEKVNEGTRNRRAKIKGCEGEIRDFEWAALKERYNYTCLRCGLQEPDVELTLDHVLPIDLGGPNTIDNAQPLCRPCNSSKGARFIDYRIDYVARL